ncbi:OmpA family protein [Pseudorhodoferax sp.]|uniref:OmpA family protein n=1 Tax=Pseudorhodoferax sp. TaxID=1993553 RepID=UPI002DD6400B|nr:OmpA family protein [Pseudorhodoferax sp.]
MFKTTMRATLVALSLGAVMAAQAQAPAPVLRMNQVTEQALLDALAIDEPVAEEAVRTRSIRPTARSNAPRPAAAAGRSNLLITFTTNSAELTNESKTALGTVAKALQSDKLSGFSFSIEGHADPRGNAELNQRLSEARAQSVAAFLVSSHGVAADRLVPVGKGSSELLNTDRPEAPENRRVTIVTRRQ